MIHPSAIVSHKAKIGDGVEIGPFSIIHDNVVIGNNVKISAYCELGVKTPLGDGSPLVIGPQSLIRSYSVFYESSSFGEGLVTGHRVTVRENTRAGTSFQIGTLSEIQGDTFVGDFVRFQSNIFVGKGTSVGNFVWVFPYVVLTNDPTPPSSFLIGCTISDYAILCASSLILPGVKVGERAVVAASACVTKDVAADIVVAGVPAKFLCESKNILRPDGSGLSAYPWVKHFHRGYPNDIVKKWLSND